ncbi:hypothetical protein SOM61_22725 [Massilia sp. CFBP9012]|uniref:hypothetical protein n=1 Tax=Massilia sp. CFBP9012 TaxID=3096531 RepID=UPI002A69C670|nr:hypothetical protein [Massilia sp. CFBP9012]MDY0977782.1 hypothetical protein [Massilia sp. CFBP9012]
MPDSAKVRATHLDAATPMPLPGMPALDLSLAFPAALRPAAAALTASAAWRPEGLHYTYQVTLEGETLTIPSRLYFDRSLPLDDAGRDATARGIAWCLGTRHHDGYLREECLARLLDAPQDWAAPFIVHLVGEYVDEIVEHIEAALPAFAPDMRAALAAFVRDNPRYLDTIERRTISYRPYVCPASESYPGKRVIACLRALGRET